MTEVILRQAQDRLLVRTTGERDNSVVQDMLGELRAQCPDLWPLAQQWLGNSICLQLIHFLSSSPRQWLRLADLAGELGQRDEEVQAALACLIEQRIVRRMEVPEVGMVFYQLSDRAPEREQVACFREWSCRWSAHLQAAERALGAGQHCHPQG